MMRRLIGMALAGALGVALAPLPAFADALPGPTLVAPAPGGTVDQPIFRWNTVASAAYYEIEVALDDQFVTVVDTSAVAGTAYAPTRTYQAKTMYWHVRSVAADGTPGDWGATQEFTRRWTNLDEPAGSDVGGIPASRVENLRLIDGGSTPAINHVGFTWDPVPGAAFYEVQFSDGQHLYDTCWTPHTSLTPYHLGDYVRRNPLFDELCTVNSPHRPPLSPAPWTANTDRIVIEAGGVEVGDSVLVRYSALGPESTLTVTSVQRDAEGNVTSFTIPNTGAPAEASGNLMWLKIGLNFEPGKTYYARVRAVDWPTKEDYPRPPDHSAVYGLWSDQKREPNEQAPGPLAFTPGNRAGAGSMSQPATPLTPQVSGTDAPLLRWTPVPLADGYRVVVALDRDFTDVVATYHTRSDMLVPNEVYDDNGTNRSYYWFALPCHLLTEDASELTCDVAYRAAINTPEYVGQFAKRSQPITGLTATASDEKANAELRWGDALTAATATGAGQTPGGVSGYEVQITTTVWSKATSIVTDSLALTTASLPAVRGAGTFRWRVRPLDGQKVPLSWAVGPEFTLGSTGSGSGSTQDPNPGESWNPNYDQTAGTESTSKATAPGKPGKPSAERFNRRTLRLKWRASAEMGAAVTGYRVYRATDGQSFTQVRKVSANRLKLRAKRGKTYWFYVVADSQAGQSDPSRTTKFRMPR